MLVCRIISLFFLLYTLAPTALLAKKISQDDIGTEEVLKSGDVSLMSSEIESLENSVSPNETESVLGNSSEIYKNSDASLFDDTLLDEDGFGYVIEKFINEMEGFWQEIKSHLLEQNSKTAPPGNWWHEGAEYKYKAMKDRFYKEVPATLPQKIKDIINEYEMRYNDLMWSEIENDPNLINRASNEEYIYDNDPIRSQQSDLEQSEGQQNESLKGSINNGKCKKRSFEDIFEAKVTKGRSYSTIEYND